MLIFVYAERRYFLIKIYNMDVISIKDTKYYSIDKFMLLNGIKSKKTVYNWVDNGWAERRTYFNTSFFRRLK